MRCGLKLGAEGVTHVFMAGGRDTLLYPIV